MIRSLILLSLTVFVFGNPFHKYPYVFLLDVGNEELQKVNTEQIRISKEGGSLALRYPAIGNGPDIAHVRVSGIDFGTDLKAEIVEGGPGYKYVVLVLMGNQGVNFDAVITIQTVPANDEENLQNIDSLNQVEEKDDPNDSAEDLSDDEPKVNDNENSELTQQSSNVYYAVNEALSGYGNDIHSSQNNYDNQSDQDADQDDQQDEDEEDNQEEENNQFSDDDQTNEGLPQNENSEENNVYYPALDQRFDSEDGRQVNPSYEHQVRPNYNRAIQSAPPEQSDIVYIEEPNDGNTLNLEELFSVEYDEDDGSSRQYSDKNNNFIDRSDGSAVAY